MAHLQYNFLSTLKKDFNRETLEDYYTTQTGTHIFNGMGVWGRVVLDENGNMCEEGADITLQNGYTIIDYQPRYSKATNGNSIVRVSVSKGHFGDRVNGEFVTEDEFKELVEKVTKEKLSEYVSKAKEYYNAEKAKDEEIAKESEEELNELLGNFQNRNFGDHDGPEDY